MVVCGGGVGSGGVPVPVVVVGCTVVVVVGADWGSVNYGHYYMFYNILFNN